MVADDTPRRIVIRKHIPLATGLGYVKYRVNDIEKVMFPGQSHGLGQRCPDNQFLAHDQIGFLFQWALNYFDDRNLT